MLINGGDTYVTDYIEGVNGEDAEEYGFSIQGRNSLDGNIDGINQEGIFSSSKKESSSSKASKSSSKKDSSSSKAGKSGSSKRNNPWWWWWF